MYSTSLCAVHCTLCSALFVLRTLCNTFIMVIPLWVLTVTDFYLIHTECIYNSHYTSDLTITFFVTGQILILKLFIHCVNYGISYFCFQCISGNQKIPYSETRESKSISLYMDVLLVRHLHYSLPLWWNCFSNLQRKILFVLQNHIYKLLWQKTIIMHDRSFAVVKIFNLCTSKHFYSILYSIYI